MDIFEGLYTYEQVLLTLGCLLFIATFFVLFYSLLRKENIIRSIPFFLVSIIMVGYPSIERIELEKDKLAIYKKIEKLAKDPQESQVRIRLEETLEKVVQRPNLAPETLLRVTFLQSLYFPEQFDSFVKINKNRYTQEFFLCIDNIKRRLTDQVLLPKKSCNNFSDPEKKNQCILDNDSWKMIMMLESIEKVIGGETLWLDTLHGIATSISKNILGEEYQKIITQFQASFEEKLSCSVNL